MKIMKNRASKFGRFKYKKYQKPNPSRGKYNNTENRGFMIKSSKIPKTLVANSRMKQFLIKF